MNAPRHRDIHIMECSMQFSDSEPDVREDLNIIFGRKADAYIFTEASKGKIRPLIRTAARNHGYWVFGGLDDITIAVKNKHEHLDHGNKKAHGGLAHQYYARYVTFVKFNFDGEIITVCGAHWVRRLTSWRRKRDHRLMTRTMIDMVQKYGGGRAICFFGGDTNVNERYDLGKDRTKPDWMFDQAGLTTIWDELKVLKGTRGKNTIDIIGSYDLDMRVRALSVKVWPPLHSDHKQLSGYYRIYY